MNYLKVLIQIKKMKNEKIGSGMQIKGSDIYLKEIFFEIFKKLERYFYNI